MCGLLTGEVILPTAIPNNAHHNTEVEYMTQIEIKQSKYGPHRYSNNSDDMDRVIATHQHIDTTDGTTSNVSSVHQHTDDSDGSTTNITLSSTHNDTADGNVSSPTHYQHVEATDGTTTNTRKISDTNSVTSSQRVCIMFY